MKEALEGLSVAVLAVMLWCLAVVISITPFVLTVLAAIWLAGKMGLIS